MESLLDRQNAMIGNIKALTKHAIAVGDLAPVHISTLEQVEKLLNSIVIGKSKKQLLIFDLNGILVDREYETDKTIEKDGATRLGNFLVWKKSNIDKMLKKLFEHHAVYEIAVWSSVTKYNVEQLAKFTFGEHYEKLLFVFNQDQCESVKNPDPESKKPLFLKNLREVWLKYPQYDPTNTLLIDDSDDKSRNNPKECHFNPIKDGMAVTNAIFDKLACK